MSLEVKERGLDGLETGVSSVDGQAERALLYGHVI
jgi:hypothetical protein